MSDDYRTTDLAIFVFEDTHQVRMFVDAHGNPFFLLSDICLAQGTEAKNVLRRLDDDEKFQVRKETLGIKDDNDILNPLEWALGNPEEYAPGRGNPLVWCVTEAGFYRVAIDSRTPLGHRFKRWVLHEVLPQIRKTGAYVAPGLKRELPPRQRTTPVEVSIQMARVWRLLRSTEDAWYSNRELALETGASRRAVSSYTHYWLQIGLLERHEVFPRHLYRLAPTAARQYARIWRHLDTCADILIRRAEY